MLDLTEVLSYLEEEDENTEELKQESSTSTIRPTYGFVRILAKCEFLNPGFSAKDRLMWNTLKNAQILGNLHKGMTVLSVLYNAKDDSGQATAMVCAMQSFPCLMLVPSNLEHTSKIQTIKAYGAQVMFMDVTKSGELRDHAQKMAEESPEDLFFCDKKGIKNTKSIQETYAEEMIPELLAQVPTMTHFVVSEKNDVISTCLKDHNVNCIFAESSNRTAQDIKAADEMCRLLAKKFGLLVGRKSGFNILNAINIAKTLQSGVICSVLPDVGLKFLDSIFAEPGAIMQSASPSKVLPRVGEAFQLIDLIGSTPLVDLSHLVENKFGKKPKLYGKVEFFNPGFSIKDRIVKNILGKAIEEHRLLPGMTVVAASSGNTGAATAMFCAALGYPCIITTSPKCSKEKMDSIKAYGATLMVSPPHAKEGQKEHYMNMARDLALSAPDKYFDVDQYDNLDNPEAHELTLAKEIWEQTNGKVTAFVAGGSTGGTISGNSRGLKKRNPDIKAIFSDPTGSVLHQYVEKKQTVKAGKFLVEGVGKGSLPGCMDVDQVDDFILVEDKQAFQMCDFLSRTEGLLAGGSGGMNFFAALQYANNVQDDEQVIVTVFPDSGIKYQSKIYNQEWLEENGVEFEKIELGY